MADKPTKEELLILTKLIDYAQSAIRYALTDRHCSEGEPMYPIAISMLNFTIKDLNDKTYGMFEGETNESC